MQLENEKKRSNLFRTAYEGKTLRENLGLVRPTNLRYDKQLLER